MVGGASCATTLGAGAPCATGGRSAAGPIRWMYPPAFHIPDWQPEYHRHSVAVCCIFLRTSLALPKLSPSLSCLRSSGRVAQALSHPPPAAAATARNPPVAPPRAPPTLCRLTMVAVTRLILLVALLMVFIPPAHPARLLRGGIYNRLNYYY